MSCKERDASYDRTPDNIPLSKKTVAIMTRALALSGRTYPEVWTIVHRRGRPPSACRHTSYPWTSCRVLLWRENALPSWSSSRRRRVPVDECRLCVSSSGTWVQTNDSDRRPSAPALTTTHCNTTNCSAVAFYESTIAVSSLMNALCIARLDNLNVYAYVFNRLMEKTVNKPQRVTYVIV